MSFVVIYLYPLERAPSLTARQQYAILWSPLSRSSFFRFVCLHPLQRQALSFSPPLDGFADDLPITYVLWSVVVVGPGGLASLP